MLFGSLEFGVEVSVLGLFSVGGRMVVGFRFLVFSLGCVGVCYIRKIMSFEAGGGIVEIREKIV